MKRLQWKLINPLISCPSQNMNHSRDKFCYTWYNLSSIQFCRSLCLQAHSWEDVIASVQQPDWMDMLSCLARVSNTAIFLINHLPFWQSRRCAISPRSVCPVTDSRSFNVNMKCYEQLTGFSSGGWRRHGWKTTGMTIMGHSWFLSFLFCFLHLQSLDIKILDHGVGDTISLLDLDTKTGLLQ